jgi:branched-subunit amino acid aminotransferase/4-amino-4-deoxychorismate lyase
MDRFTRGAAVLKLRPPLTALEMGRAVHRLIKLNGFAEAILRITLTRGHGPRGYSPKGADKPTLAMTLHDVPRHGVNTFASVRLITSAHRVAADDPLANVKTCNKLSHVLARAEAEAAGADDALLLNTRGHMAEATASNLFWISGRTLSTPPARAGALPGITRAVVLELAGKLGLAPGEVEAKPEVLHEASAVFLTNSVGGITEVLALNGRAMRRSSVVKRLQAAYKKLLRQQSKQLSS